MVRDVAVLFAIGIGPDEFRRVLGVSGDLLDAEVHWGAFFESFVLGGCVWQRCQFHLAQNANHHTPSQKIQKRIGAELLQI